MKKYRSILLHGLFFASVLALILMVFPFPTKVRCAGTAVEYSLSDESFAVEHQILIEGRYYRSVFLKDFYKGTFYISGVRDLEPDKQVTLDLAPGKQLVYPAFQDNCGQPHTTEIARILCGKDFFPIAVQFFRTNRQEEVGRSSTSFLVTGAESREDALRLYTTLQ